MFIYYCGMIIISQKYEEKKNIAKKNRYFCNSVATFWHLQCI